MTAFKVTKEVCNLQARNSRQESLIDKLRGQIGKLKKRCERQQQIISKLKDYNLKPTNKTAIEKAEQLFIKGDNN